MAITYRIPGLLSGVYGVATFFDEGQWRGTVSNLYD